MSQGEQPRRKVHKWKIISSVEKIAKISGVSASTIRGWVNDKKIPTLNNAQWVLSALGYNLTLEKKSTTEEAGEKEE